MDSRWNITSPWVFYGLFGLLVAYVLYTIFRRRKGDRAGKDEIEPEL